MKQRANRKRLSAYAGSNTVVGHVRTKHGRRVTYYSPGWRHAKQSDIEHTRLMRQWGMR